MRKILVIGLAVLAATPLFAIAAASDFIDGAPAMTADAKNPGAMIYVAPGRSLKGFDQVAIEPIEIWYAADSKYKGVEPNELAGVTNSLREALVKTLAPTYPVVPTSGPGVVHVRLAVTNVNAQKSKRSLLGYTPVGFVVGAAKDAANSGPNIDLRAATIEAELLDADGVRIAVVTEPLFAGSSKKEALTWKVIGAALDAYGTRLRARLDADNAP